ncbi:hypothetical protein HaloA020_29510 [Halomonas sp. A020]|uniref:hypothetical protein n=1 Tax=Halomonas sp. A020 TaxID=2717374 RepID=UPI002492EB87|nr:hypothetical protein [Halomonas sp. A020]BCB62250.1 hypothetical protein HaloA020_29510 [Halomonas sp. A020]
MASVTFPEALGGNGQTYTDDADPNTGLDGLGYTVRFIPCLQQAVIMGLSAQSNAQAAAEYVQQCQTLREEVGNDRLAVAADRQHVDQQRQAVDTAAASAAQSAASVNADNIVHAPGSGLPNEAGEAYSRGVVGGPGDLIAQGAFGFGAAISPPVWPLASLNDNPTSVPSGLYRVNQSVPGSPGFGTLFWQRYNATEGTLTWRNIAGATVRVQERSYSGVWGEWSRVFHDRSILGTVSHSDGVPTGAIFQRDSNDFGSWSKCADGTVEFKSTTISNIQVDIAEGGLYKSQTIAFTYPLPNLSFPRVYGCTNNDSTAVAVSVGATQANARLIKGSPGSGGQLYLQGLAYWF